ncbi:MAG TPA: hypothetical protein VEX86_15875, partial [Longimicrobium sp.]|nr:hypothetical protein [Longimicrobium sp.]
MTLPADYPADLPRVHIADFRGKIDFAILTMRDDEQSAVHGQFPPMAIAEVEGEGHGRWPYAISWVPTPTGIHTVAMVQCIRQGTTHAQRVASNTIDDLHPRWLLAVGIAGGVPSPTFTLGDVVVSSFVHDLSLMAASGPGRTDYAAGGGPMTERAEQVLSGLGALAPTLKGWNSPRAIRAKAPQLVLENLSIAGDSEYQARVITGLKAGFIKGHRRPPRVVLGEIGSSSTLIIDPAAAEDLCASFRKLIAFEMEFAGIQAAARNAAPGGRDLPTLTIRGISDIIGLTREEGWKNYAAHSAAAFARALIERGRLVSPSLPISLNATIPSDLSLPLQPIHRSAQHVREALDRFAVDEKQSHLLQRHISGVAAQLEQQTERLRHGEI